MRYRGGLEVLPEIERDYSFDPFEENPLHCNFPQAEVHQPGSILCGGEVLQPRKRMFAGRHDFEVFDNGP